MYKNGYVLALIADGNVLEEDDSKRVCMPFGTEYKARLINKNYERCAADLLINGEQIARFIVNAGETVDIERYLDGNLNSGKRFKFTSLNDSQVKNKKDIDNGIVEVHFYKERKKSDPIIIKEEHHHHYDRYPYIPPVSPWPKQPWYPYNPWYYCEGNGGNITFNNSKGMSASGGSAIISDVCSTPTSCRSMAELSGATVRGSESQQSFKEISGYEFESTTTILKLKIVNGEPAISVKYCNGCGRKRRDGEKYCPSCGTKLI